uniref:Uncharacterized protein n=1 Tax=Opuntia streptacantha TaxID=393608 RepID=A0A7C9DM07_OPUST
MQFVLFCSYSVFHNWCRDLDLDQICIIFLSFVVLPFLLSLIQTRPNSYVQVTILHRRVQILMKINPFRMVIIDFFLIKVLEYKDIYFISEHVTFSISLIVKY